MALSGWYVLKRRKAEGWRDERRSERGDWGNFLEPVRPKSLGSHVTTHTDERGAVFELRHDVLGTLTLLKLYYILLILSFHFVFFGLLLNSKQLAFHLYHHQSNFFPLCPIHSWVKVPANLGRSCCSLMAEREKEAWICGNVCGRGQGVCQCVCVHECY